VSLTDPRASDTAELDRDLLRAIAKGSADALAALYDRHAPLVFGLARRMTGHLEDAEEIAQDVFAQVWRQAVRYEEARASVAGWLVMITRTRAIDRVRSRSARPDQVAPVEPDETVVRAGDPSPVPKRSRSRPTMRVMCGRPSRRCPNRSGP
jgi:RNA polymerase sigma-70 factor (ECF subfamily)